MVHVCVGVRCVCCVPYVALVVRGVVALPTLGRETLHWYMAVRVYIQSHSRSYQYMRTMPPVFMLYLGSVIRTILRRCTEK